MCFSPCVLFCLFSPFDIVLIHCDGCYLCRISTHEVKVLKSLIVQIVMFYLPRSSDHSKNEMLNIIC